MRTRYSIHRHPVLRAQVLEVILGAYSRAQQDIEVLDAGDDAYDEDHALALNELCTACWGALRLAQDDTSDEAERAIRIALKLVLDPAADGVPKGKVDAAQASEVSEQMAELDLSSTRCLMSQRVEESAFRKASVENGTFIEVDVSVLDEPALGPLIRIKVAASTKLGSGSAVAGVWSPQAGTFCGEVSSLLDGIYGANSLAPSMYAGEVCSHLLAHLRSRAEISSLALDELGPVCAQAMGRIRERNGHGVASLPAPKLVMDLAFPVIDRLENRRAHGGIRV